MTQNEFLQDLMRGTGITLTAKEASDKFGIKNLRARMTQLRKAGLNVRTKRMDGSSEVRYSITGRDINGSRAKVAF